MDLPEGYDWLDNGSASPDRYVLKLRKALYGLKTSPRLWYNELSEFLKSLGFTPAKADPNLYIRGDCILLVYVDDLLTAYDPKMHYIDGHLRA